MSKSPKAVARQSRRQARRSIPSNLDYQGIEEFKTSRPKVDLIKPLTDAQREYDAAIRSSRVVFGVGPAGTGKTWFAAMRAAEALDTRVIEKIVITRPAVEAEESLGFLPGELEEKYEPFIRPFRDAFEERFGKGHLEYLLRKKVIEPRPLAYLRGSTLKNCWVLLDEAQNTTPGQMKMFLTRIGKESKFLINGDLRQSDISGPNGLADAIDRIGHVAGIQTVTFGVEDVVRDDICMDIIKGYES